MKFGAILIVAFVAYRSTIAAEEALDGQQKKIAEAELKLDRQEFFLGENIAVAYTVENKGPVPLPYAGGSSYPELRVMNFIRCSATKVDQQGKPNGKPVVVFPMPMDLGGLVGNNKLKSGESRSVTVFVTRYLRFEEPGDYELKIENIDPRRAKQVMSSGGTRITMKQPTLTEARAIYQKVKAAPREAWDDNNMVFLADAADFETMYQPVYWPILKEFANKGDLDALPSLGKAQTLAANEILVQAMLTALDDENWPFARQCFGQLKDCFPFHSWYAKGPAESAYAAERERVARTWKADFNPALIRLARRLTIEAETPDSRHNDEEIQKLLAEVATIYASVGQPEDFSDAMHAFRKSIELTKTLPLETQQYFRPRGSAYGFHFVVINLLERGAKIPVSPTNPAEAAAFAIALKRQKNFRPDGWQAEVMRWLKSGEPYVAELFLDYMPEPVPQEVFDHLPTLLADKYVDLQIAACHVAEKHPHAEFKKPLQQVLDSATEKYLRKFAVDAARANGLEAKYDKGAPFVSE